MRYSLTVRRATAEDTEAVAEMEALCFPDAWSAASLRSHAEGEGGLLLIAEREGAPIGYLTARLLPPECELYRIAVLPISRHTGAASALMEHFFAILKGEACTALFLEVRESNAPAISLYKKFGMREIGRRKRYYRDPTEDALLFAREDGE
jgi:ribosomal-protein-alanine N-acetyltransferase